METLASLWQVDIDRQLARARALSEQFEKHAGPETGWIADQVAQYKVSYGDPDLRVWTTGELHEVLLEVMPRKSSLDDADIAQVVPTTAAFLRWLGSSGRLAVPAEPLAVYVESLAGPFAEAMRDESRWGMAKRLFSGVDLSGLDLSDPAALQHVIDEFNARPFAERDQILGSAPGTALPPVVLAPPEELRAAAQEVVWRQRAEVLCDEIGEKGLATTSKGNLKLADARRLLPLLGVADQMDPVIGDRVWKTTSSEQLPELYLTVQLALEAGFLEDTGTRLRATSEAAVLREDPAQAVFLLLGALLAVGPLTVGQGEDPYGLRWYSDLVDSELPHLLTELYGGTVLTPASWEADLWDQALPGFVEGAPPDRLGFARSGLRGGVGKALRRLAEMGALTVVSGDWPSWDDALQDGWGSVEFALTPLGTWALQQVLSVHGSAPTVGALASATADELLVAVADRTEAEAAAELDHWVSLHGPEPLAAAFADADDVGRGLAFRALLRLGDAANDAVASLPATVSAYTEIWRVDHQLLPPTPVEDPARLVEVLRAVLELWGPSAVARWVTLLSPAPLPLVEQAWRIAGAEEVLAALGSESADKHLAKAARKALFKHRSAR